MLDDSLTRGIANLDQSPGRNWSTELLVGVHASSPIEWPYIHVLLKDMVVAAIKDKSYYNSFHISFFIGLDELPLTPDQIRRRKDCFKEGLKCWRCGAMFGQDMKGLKEHLAEELDQWKKE